MKCIFPLIIGSFLLLGGQVFSETVQPQPQPKPEPQPKPQPQLANFQPFTQEIKLENASLPQTMEIELPAAGHVVFEKLKLPPKAVFFAQFPKGEGHLGNASWGHMRLSAGKHTIVIKDRWGKVYPGAIHIKATISPENDASEPNDQPGQARPISLGENALSIFPAGESDYLKVTLKDRGYLSVYPANPPKGFASHCQVFDPFGKSLGFNHVHIEVPGEYLLKCSDRWGRYGSTKPLKFKMEFTPEEDFAEPNNLIPDAADIPLGVWQQALVAPAKDVDYHRIEIASHGRLVIHTADVDKALVLNSQIFDAEGNKLNLAYPYTVSPGKYYISLYDRWGKWSLKPYRLKFDLMPVDRITPVGAKEATLIEPGKRYSTRLPGGKETDRFAVKLDGLSIVHATLEVPEGSDYRLSYKEGEAKPIQARTLWVRTQVSRPEFTIYARYEKASFDPVMLRAEVEAEFDPSEPNDYTNAPADLELAKPRMFYLYPSGDQDWFKVKVSEPGKYFLHVVQPGDDSSQRIHRVAASWNDAAGKRLSKLSMKPQSYGFSSQVIDVGQAGEFLIWLSSKSSSRSPLVVGLSKQSNLFVADKSKTEGLDVFVAGVELKGGVAKRMEAMVNQGGGSFVNAVKADEIGEKLIEISDEIEKRSSVDEVEEEESSSRWWLWLLVLVLLVLPGAYFYFKGKKGVSQKDVSQGDTSDE